MVKRWPQLSGRGLPPLIRPMPQSKHSFLGRSSLMGLYWFLWNDTRSKSNVHHWWNLLQMLRWSGNKSNFIKVKVGNRLKKYKLSPCSAFDMWKMKNRRQQLMTSSRQHQPGGQWDQEQWEVQHSQSCDQGPGPLPPLPLCPHAPGLDIQCTWE